ncbi:MAG: hypothetical protein JOZ04_05640 [Acidimicrobiia bacterium]|nr:hypothetical protein [Acidimicrobiia bacterium]
MSTRESVVRRWPALLVLLVLLVAAGFVDHSFSRPTAAVGTAAAGMPVAPPAGALSSTWYCAGGTADPNGTADMSVAVANDGDDTRTGTITFTPSQGDPKSVAVSIPAASRAVFRAQDAVKAPYVAATVELDGGAAAAEVGVGGTLGASVAGCASSASENWYFAEGVTTKDAGETLFLYNPFPEDAIVDLTFSTEDGQSAPQELQGLAIHGRGLLPINVGDYVHRRAQVSTQIATRVGRIVVSRLQTFDGTAGRKGQSLALGAPARSRTWYFPEGIVSNGITERYQLFNPSDREVRAELNLALEQGAAEPIDVTVPAQARVTVSANDEKRIPRQVAHAVTVTAEDPGLVVERAIDAAPPAPRAGFSSIVGATTTHDHWLLAVGEADEGWDEWVVVQNPGQRSVTFSVTALADGQRVGVDGAQDVEVPAGQRLAIRLGDHIKRQDLPIAVDATGLVAVERDMYPTKGLSLIMGIGIPLA